MKTKASIGYKTLLYYGNRWLSPSASPEQFTKIAEVKSIDGFGVQRSETDATHMESDGEAIERIGGLKDGQVVTVVTNMTSDNVDTLKDLVDDADSVNFRIDFRMKEAGVTTTKSYYFSGIPLTWKIQGLTPSGVKEVSFGLRITGDITD